MTDSQLRRELKKVVSKTFNEWVKGNKSMQDILADQLLILFKQRSKGWEKSLRKKIGMLRQWINEDRITDKKMVTNEELEHWLLS